MDNIKYYKITEARAMLNISKTKLYELMKNGDLRYITIGSVRRIPHAELLRFQEAHLLPA